MTLWAAAPALLLLATAAGAVPQGPSSGTCGLPPPFDEPHLKAHISGIFDEVYDLAKPGEDVSLVFIKPLSRPNVFAASKERAKETFGVDVPSDHAILFDLFYCDFLHSEDELANVLAHEFGHLEKDHEPKLVYLLKEAEKAKDLGDEYQKRLDKFYAYSNAAEFEADRLGTSYLSRKGSRFQPGANEFREISMALKLDGKDPEVSSKSHPKLSERDKAVKFWAAFYTLPVQP